jgi:hypothetical protein
MAAALRFAVLALASRALALNIGPDPSIEKFMWHEEESERIIDMIISEVVPTPNYATTRSDLARTQISGNMSHEHLFWVFAAHHKAGTHLIRNMARYQREALDVGDCENFGCNACSKHWGAEAPKGTRMWFSCDYTEEQYKAMQIFAQSNANVRTVHIVRDPFALVISGYIYHLYVNDHCDAKCQHIRNMSIYDGVAVESEWALSHTLVDMLRTYELGSNDIGIMVVRMEDFIHSSQDFDTTVHRMYEHNEVDAFLTAEQQHSLEMQAQQEDLNRHPDHDAGHQASKDMKYKAAQALQRIPQHLRMQLEEVGEKLGYAYK